jgi:ribonucleoside-diphosphate reductase alpha chain
MDLLRKRYFLKDENGKLLENSWEDVCKRVSKNIASAEETADLQNTYEKIFYDKMVSLEFIPSSPAIFNAGTKLQQLSSCFIIDIEDTMEGIAESWKESSVIFKSGGGAGLNISKVRPNGAIVSSSNGEASGVVSFMSIFNQIVEIIKQGGRRKGALKIDLNENHPEIFDFIHCKDDTESLQNMNISVSISDKFMNALINDENIDLEFNGKIYQTIKAKELWDEIISSAWKSGEPGVSFRDIMNDDNKNPHLGEIVSSNPCQEFVNIPYSSCNLGSINLEKVVKDKKIDYKLLENNIRVAVRFLDNMISVNKLPLEKIDKITKAIRPIGIGTIGYANMLYLLEMPYNSKQAYKATDKLYEFILNTAIDESKNIAEEKGIYPAWEGSIWQKENIKIRNSNHISIAPNGSIGFISDSTGGIEPEYALVYNRTTNEGTKYFVVNKMFENKLKELGLYTEELLQKIIENNGSIQNIKEIPSNVRKVFIVSHDLKPSEHLKTVSIISKHVDLSISKTINLSNEATKEEISEIYIEAWKNNIKGITIYRDGSRKNQILSTSQEKEIKINMLPRGHILPALSETNGHRIKLTTGCGNLWLMVFTDENNDIIETFINTGSKGGCGTSTQAMSRLMSLSLRGGISFEDVIDQLESAGSCPSYQFARGNGSKISAGKSCPSAIAKALDKLQKKLKKGDQSSTVEIEEIICPECGTKLIFNEGCSSCFNCGFSKCS